MEENANLETMARSFYSALANGSTLIPVVLAALGLVICLMTGVRIWQIVDRGDAYGQDGPAGSILAQCIGFAFGALLGISAIVTYRLSEMWG